MLVGSGDLGSLDANRLRDAAAAFARTAGKHSLLAFRLPVTAGLGSDAASQAVVEGVILARYRFDSLRADKGIPVGACTVVVAADQLTAAAAGAARGKLFADAQSLSRDLAGAPAVYLTAPRMADIAAEVAAATGLEIEVSDRAALEALGCGGLLGVNAGSAEEPRVTVDLSTGFGWQRDPSGAGWQGHHVRLGWREHQASRRVSTRR